MIRSRVDEEFESFVLVFPSCHEMVMREKSEAIVFFPAKQRGSLPADEYITVAGHRIQPSSCVRNLGVLFDSNLKMEHQIANIVKSCYYQIRIIGGIRIHLTEESGKTFVHALVTSRLDYGNALVQMYTHRTWKHGRRI